MLSPRTTENTEVTEKAPKEREDAEEIEIGTPADLTETRPRSTRTIKFAIILH
jgi:hypothetical protein